MTPPDNVDNKRKFTGTLLLQVILFLFFLFIVAPFVWGVGRINPRVYLGNVSLRGAVSELESKIKSECSSYQTKPIKIFFDGKSISTSLSEVGFKVDGEKTSENLNNSFLYKNFSPKYIVKWWEDLLLGFKIPVFYSFEEKDLQSFLKNNFKIALSESQEAEFRFENNNILITPSKKGVGVDNLFFVAQALENLKKWESNQIKIRMVEINPDISTSEAESMKETLEKLFDYPFAFKAKDYNFNIPKNIILSWIEVKKDQKIGSFSVDEKEGDVKVLTNLITAGQDFSDLKKKYGFTWDVNKVAVEAFLKKEVESLIYRKSENGILAFENNEIKEIKSSSPEVVMDVAKSVEMIISALKNNNYFISLPVEEKPATISLAKVKELGLTTLLASGESNFVGSPVNRRHNISVGSSKFNGVIIEKDSEFSFITTLGPVDKSTGYLPELVIKQDKTIPEYGGGMCQVSSTAFRGAVKAGLRITERQNHAYPVQYYSPQGTDATVYIPKPDLKFLNDTPAPILLQTRMEGNLLYFDFFGKSDERKVELEGPRTFDKKPDGSMKAEWIQKVFDKNGNLLFQKNFLSKYESPSKFPHPGDEKPPTVKKKKKKGGT